MAFAPITALAALTASVTLAAPALAAGGDYVPAPAISIVVDSDVPNSLIGGRDLTLKFQATSGGKNIPGKMTVSAPSDFQATSNAAGYDRLPKTVDTKSGAVSLKVHTATVTAPTPSMIRASFVRDASDPAAEADPANDGAVKADPASIAPARAEAEVTLLPRGTTNATASPISGILPHTGGTSIWYVITGVLLVGIGGGVVLAMRRRTNSTF